MKPTKAQPAHKAVLDRLLLEYPHVTTGIIFGLPCYKLSGKVFATLYGDGVGICLPEARAQKLLEQPQVTEFRPYGKNRGQDHVQLHREIAEDYVLDEALFVEAMQYAVDR